MMISFAILFKLGYELTQLFLPPTKGSKIAELTNGSLSQIGQRSIAEYGFETIYSKKPPIW